MSLSIKFKRLDGYEEVEVESFPLSRQAPITSHLKRYPLVFVLLTATIILSLSLLAITIIILISVNGHKASTQCGTGLPPLLVISLDGFRPDYLDSGLIPSLHSVGAEGVRAKYMMSQFPTKTFPNHYTLATGLHPAWHGIVDNSFYDKDLHLKFTIRGKSMNNPEWWLAKPIWKQARDQGLVTAVYYWPGSEVPTHLPNYYFPYKFNTPLKTQLQEVNRWLQLPTQQRPQLMMVYTYNPDHLSHTYGYYSAETNKSLRAINSDLQEFFSDSYIWNCVDKIFVSDHGFANVSLNRTLYLQDIIDLDLIQPIQMGPFITFNVKNQSQTDSILDRIRSHHGHGVVFDAYRSTEFPPRMHYGIGPRYADVIVLTRTGWLILYDHRYDNVIRGGDHGWDNHATDMRALFIGHGPSLKQKYKRTAFENVQLYGLLTTLLRIKPGAYNGSSGALNDVIADTFNGNKSSSEPSSYSPDTEVSCPFPPETLLLERVFNSTYLCGSCNKTAAAVNFLLTLNLTQAEIDSLKSSLIPGGLPRGGGGSSYCYLANGDSLIKYNNKLRVPVWAAYKLDSLLSTGYEENLRGCMYFNDPRIESDNSPLCSYYSGTSTYSMSSLLSSQFAEKGSRLTSGTLPLQGLPNLYINQTITKLKSSNSPSFVVVTGSVFLSPTSGEMIPGDQWPHWLGDKYIAIPSHIYQIIIPCVKSSSGCVLNGDGVISYIVENKNTSLTPGLWGDDYQLRLTTVREIERVSGVDFFPQLTDKQQLDIELNIRTSF